ncbi:Nitric oxide [Seminavis robusta]|uniref:Nitric oxide n=1 Tax=Seminavis robusta TaxID=568900 RepID=A0A9N8HHK4_9STRA|nr:Nitric oxide [Seminavis robusta]|eukprot:Sro453_g146070.1 Nitric oxide (792) ;mRNA; r:20034-22500
MSAIFLLASRNNVVGVKAWTSSSSNLLRRHARVKGRFSSPPLTRCFVSQSSSSSSGKKKSSQAKNKWTRKTGGKKVTLNKELHQQQAADKLAAAFEELAGKEGFGASSSSFFAKDSTFEEQFQDEDYEGFLDDDDELEGDEEEDSANYWGDGSLENNDDGIDYSDDGGPVVGQAQASDASMEARIAAAKPGRSSHLKGDDLEDLDLGDFDLPLGDDDNDDDMDARLAAAQRDLVRGQVSPDLGDITRDDMKRLGFRTELNPFEGDIDTPRQEEFKLITNPLTCSACGADFQCKNISKPGYLPPEKFEHQEKLDKLQDLQELKQKAESAEWTPEDEVEWLLQTSGGGDEDAPPMDASEDIDMDAAAAELGIDLGHELTKTKKVICKRCHGLQNFGQVDEALRPGWTDEPLMSQQKFRDLLRPLSGKPAVLIAIVDLFDFSGSVLPELDAIAGENPVILAANKADLLPPKMGQHRAETWVRRELEYMGVQSIANIGGAVRLISCKTGMGVHAMLGKARKLAEEIDGDVYVVGAANAGKSSLMNYILRGKEEPSSGPKQRKRAGNQNQRKGALTTSPLPGTTLKFIKVDLGEGRSIYDTPGLLVPGTLTQLLTPEELKIVVPNKRVEPITFRVEAGKCVQVGGLARISVIGDSKPFLFTFFVANQIKLHPTSQSKADEFVAKHVGKLLTPPLEPGPERMEQIGEFETHVVEIDGTSWKEAAADITLTGLGWVSVTGPGKAMVEIRVPKGIGIQVRPPLMPYDMWEVAAKYTGGRAIRKSGKSISGKRRKGVGRN